MSNTFLLACDIVFRFNTPMSERERFTTTLNGELLRQIKILAINQKCTVNKLLEDAMRALLEKHESKAKD